MASHKKQQLLDTALVLFVENGIQGTATAKIAKEAGVANGTLFHHFATKKALVDNLYLLTKTELSAALTPAESSLPLQQQFQHYWNSGLAWAQHNPTKLQFLRQIASDPGFSLRQQHEMMATTMGFLMTLIETGIDQGKLVKRPLPLLLNFCHSQYLATASLLIEHPDYASDPEWLQHAFALLWQAIVTPEHQQ
ncbi:TetR/AcrR family transcriptional regulator [Photobacterium kagoshimensis]|uniref:TetR/AcrR family transcriptional regulator n=1 Tax=Photobacterium kagoshimensis TaxID=2910242 RepID=UPI003D0B11B7